MKFGVFIPIANDGWITSETSPKCTAARQVNAQSKAVQDRAVVGSPQTVASYFNSLAEADPNVSIMLTFDDFLEGIERFGTEVIPLLNHKPAALAMS